MLTRFMILVLMTTAITAAASGAAGEDRRDCHA